MSFAKFFGGGAAAKKPPAPSTSEAIANCTEFISQMEKKIAHFEEKVKAEHREALKIKKQYGEKGKARQLPYLRRAARYQKQIQQLHGQIDNLEAQKLALETSSVTVGMVGQMQQMREAMRTSGMNVDDLADTIDDIREEMTNLEEISDLLAQPTTAGALDDDELLAEFEAGLVDELEADLLGEGTAELDIPEVPTRELPSAVAAPKKETDEMAELMAWTN